MELMNQPFNGQLGNRLIELLNLPDYHTLNIVVAFAKNSGVLRIKDALENFRQRGGVVNAYVGVDCEGTSYEALTALRLHTDSLNIVHAEKSQTFHPKIYQFLGKDKGIVIVGSHNLTGGGLWTNFESSLHISANASSTDGMTIRTDLEDYIKWLPTLNESFMPIASQDDIDALLKNGYLVKEVTEQIRLATTARQNGTRKRLFGNGAPAKLPRIVMLEENAPPAPSAAPKPSITIPQSDQGQTIWFETRSMTGGSRNILDLSKRSLVERGDPTGTPFYLGGLKFMRGGVEFFGLNPADINQTKNIIINFEGVDYIDNTILFPSGDNANGTWRLQIKGKSSSGQKITDTLRQKYESGYLVKKIITFTKIQDDYYFMSVFSESEIDTFKESSFILARNGATRSAKLLGLI